MRVLTYSLWKEKAGIISENSLYIVYSCKSGHMYAGETIFKLIKSIITTWKQDKNLIG